jgi:hypothetical protein
VIGVLSACPATLPPAPPGGAHAVASASGGATTVPTPAAEPEAGAPGDAGAPNAQPSGFAKPQLPAEPDPNDASRCDLPLKQAGVLDECKGSFFRFASVDGVCRKFIYGGCSGTAKSFRTIEECRALCERRPSAEPCPKGHVARELCVSCDTDGTCQRRQLVCAQHCQGRGYVNNQCESNEELGCFDGICQRERCR